MKITVDLTEWEIKALIRGIAKVADGYWASYQRIRGDAKSGKIEHDEDYDKRTGHFLERTAQTETLLQKVQAAIDEADQREDKENDKAE